ncbi:MAG: glycoside hydrolase 43 family protein [Kiritimatiellia bacterium]|nr:glycoside hydrolase 43 family protein [Lentisphaerota bacterium]
MITNDNPSQKVLPDIHVARTGLNFNEPDFKFSGGDQGDGTYRNHIVFADYADPDVIRVGDDFYAISSTFHLNPGVTILHSRDLVNWRIIGHAVEDLSKLHPDFSFNAMRGYGSGIWAPALRQHDGMFYIHVGGPRIGLIVCKAPAITGPWTVRRMRLHVPWTDGKLIDCCPLWDDDGQAYFAAAEPRRYPQGATVVCEYKMLLFRMSADGEQLLDGGTLIHGGRTTEAIKLYKINGYYYILYVEHPMDENGRRTQFAARSRNIYGPYERRELIHSHGPARDMCPSQGGLVATAQGTWHFLCHGMHDAREAPAMAVGRPLALLPVTWKDDWPIIGEDLDKDGLGEMVWQARKPVAGTEPQSPRSSDDFDGPDLGAQWQWNHAPRNDCWSLAERAGCLRLRAARPVYPGGFYCACNTITQRLMGDQSRGTALLHTDGMANGQYSGLCLMAEPSQLIGVYMENGRKRLRYQYTRRLPGLAAPESGRDYSDDFFCLDIRDLEGESIWLRLEHELNSARLYFSLDGRTFEPAAEARRFDFHAWRGGRIGLFTWNDFKEQGCADFDCLQYEFS